MNLIRKYFAETNAFLYTGCWYLVAFLALFHYSNAIILLTLVFVLFHFGFSPTRLNDLKFILIATLLGFGLEAFIQYLEILKYQNQSYFLFIPVWVVSLWVQTILSLPHSCKTFLKSYIRSFFLGCLAAFFPYQFALNTGLMTSEKSSLILFISLLIPWAFLFFLLKVLFSKLYEKPQIKNENH